MTTLTASKARASLYKLLDKTALSHDPVQITGKRHNAVLVSQEDYEALLETLELLSAPGFAKSIREAREDIRAGRTKPLDQVFGR